MNRYSLGRLASRRAERATGGRSPPIQAVRITTVCAPRGSPRPAPTASGRTASPDRGLQCFGPMRLVAGALAIALFAPFVRADETTPGAPVSPYDAADAQTHRDAHSKGALRVVRVMPESRQALLFDKSRSTHVLVELGGKVDGYTVDDIDDDTVTLVRDGNQVILAAPQHGRDRREHSDVRARSAAPRGPEAAT